jgi:hypothetical protein
MAEKAQKVLNRLDFAKVMGYGIRASGAAWSQAVSADRP